MTTLDVIENNISAVQKYLKILERYKQFSRKTIEKDIDLSAAPWSGIFIWRSNRRLIWRRPSSLIEIFESLQP